MKFDVINITNEIKNFSLSNQTTKNRKIITARERKFVEPQFLQRFLYTIHRKNSLCELLLNLKIYFIKRNSIVNIFIFLSFLQNFLMKIRKHHNTVFSDHKDNTIRIRCEVD